LFKIVREGEICILNNAHNHRYVYGLDGVRALAILFIVTYHFSFSLARGGFLGVDIFFVLSSYLITCKILEEKEHELTFNLKKFWIGRIRRLLPVAYIVIIATGLWVILFKMELLTTLWGDSISSVFLTTNWWFIFHKLSYFDSFGTPSPLKHLWYLAVQEQFFLIWPILLTLGLRYLKKTWKFFVIVLILALCSLLLMCIMYNPETDPSRIYYGTDTRSFELLIGGLLAIVFPVKKLSSKTITNSQSITLNVLSIVTLTIFVSCAIFMDEFQAFLYRGGLFLFGLNTSLLILCVCHPRCFINNILSWKPLRWIGTRAYGIYLWHYPIMVLSTPIYEIGNPVFWHVGLQLTITCIIAEFTYVFIEMPIRKLGLKGFCREYMAFNIFKWGRLTLIKKFSAVIVMAVFVVIAIGINNLGKNKGKAEMIEAYPTEVLVSSTVVTDKAVEPSSIGKITANSEGIKVVNSPEKVTISPEVKGETNSRQKDTNPTVVSNSYTEILAVGDSIMLDIAPYLKKKYTNITIDGKVSRQMADALKLAPSYGKFNKADKAVIIELGTNGYFTDKQINSLLDYFSKAHIYLINTRVPRKWEKTVNEILESKAKEKENVELVDWYSTAIKHPEYFGRDGVHLKSVGSQALTNLISEAVNSN
jgi:peptidoglycan/LPS O-acetylase OafA/YrhL